MAYFVLHVTNWSLWNIILKYTTHLKVALDAYFHASFLNGPGKCWNLSIMCAIGTFAITNFLYSFWTKPEKYQKKPCSVIIIKREISHDSLHLNAVVHSNYAAFGNTCYFFLHWHHPLILLVVVLTLSFFYWANKTAATKSVD